MVALFVWQAQGFYLLFMSPSLISTEMGGVQVDCPAVLLVSEYFEIALAFVLRNGVVDILTLFLDQEALHVEETTVGHCRPTLQTRH